MNERPPTPELDLAELVRNRSMGPRMAATLAVAAQERRSLLFVALPRMPGKTTTMRATLAHAPAGTPLHALSGALGPSLGIPERADGGYLVMSEIAQTPFADYLWGAPVRQVFRALGDGFALATALHAPGIEEAFAVVCGRNAVPDEDASRLDLMVYMRSLGRDWSAPTRRVVAEIHEVERVVGGRPRARLLHRWLESEDRFEAVEPPQRIGSRGGDMARYVHEFEAVAGGG